MLNHISLMGRLTRDVDLRYTNNNTPVASFSVAVDRDIANNGSRETDFINCVAWRQTGEFINKYFAKGSLIALTGRLQMRSYTDKNGNKVNAAEVVVDHAYFAGEKKRDSDTTIKPKFIDADENDDLSEFPF